MDDPQYRSVADSLLRLSYQTWNFGDSIAFEAMLSASDELGDPRYAAFAHGWMRSWATRAKPYRRMDCTAPGLTMVAAAERFADGRLLAATAELADYLVGRPRLDGVFATWEHSPLMQPYGPGTLHGRFAALLASPPPGVFVDCLHFDPPFLVALGAATGLASYWREGLDQAEGYVRLLQAESGLFDHFVLDGERGTFGPGWGRGQGWALLGLLDVVEAARRIDLDPAATVVVDGLTAAALGLITSMCAAQHEDGHWSAVVDDPDSGRESSTAAFMAVGFRRALNAKIVPDEARDRVQASTDAAVTATRAALSADGSLTNVSAAVMACTESTHYSHVPRGFVAAWGQGPALLALGIS